MKSSTITLGIETNHLLRQVGDIADLLSHMPPKRARKFRHKLIWLLAQRTSLELKWRDTRFLAGDAPTCIARARLRGGDELLAAAYRAMPRGNCTGLISRSVAESHLRASAKTLSTYRDFPW